MFKLFPEAVFRNYIYQISNPLIKSPYIVQDYYSSDASTLYEALGVRNNATHAEIKEAYYRLSLKFHPDRNKGSEEAVIRFRELSEAYEILGNYVLRKRYDKGLLHPLQYKPSNQGKDPDVQQYKEFYESRKFRSRPLPPRGRSNVYNFDEFYAQHYSEHFSESGKEAKIRKIEKKKETEKSENIPVVYIGLIIVGAIASVFGLHHGNRDERKPEKKQTRNDM